MLTGDLKSKIDQIWNAFWSGGIANPIEVIEQITYLLFLRRLDDLHTLEENKATRLKKPVERRIFPEGKDARGRAYDSLRWSRFKNESPSEMFVIVGEHVFPFLRTLGSDDSTYAHHMKDARFTIPTPALLAKVVDLLDGQQRLTSLTAVLGGEPVAVRGRKRPIEILFNLDHADGPPTEALEVEGEEESPLTPDDEVDDEAADSEDVEQGFVGRLNQRTFVVASKVLAAQSNWVSVNEAFKSTDTVILIKAGITSFDDPRYEKYVDRLAKLRKIKDYHYVVHVLERDMSYEEVTEIFVRVNSLGAKLRSSDLALAQMTSRWPNLLKLLEEFQEECEKAQFTIDLGQLVRAIVVFATQQCLFRGVGSTPIDSLKGGWEQAKEGLRFAINFLKANAGIEDESLLSSPMFIHSIAAISRVKDNKLTLAEQQALLHWLLVANARGRYSRGSTETLLNEDLAIIFRGGNIAALLEPVKRQFGRLNVEPGDLAGRGANSPLFSLSYLALKHAGAKDWFSGLGLSLTHQGKLHFIQWHHVIPKSLLKDSPHGYETGEINEIANMAFITGQTNRRISNKDPGIYLPDILAKQGAGALTAQRVPADPELWKLENYRTFLQERREALAECMNTFIADKAGLSDLA